jgi:hypothetical protein
MALKNRRAAAAAALMTALLFSAAGEAAAPQQKTQAPGYYRMMLGDTEITTLSDGTFPIEADKLLTGITPKQLDAALARSYFKGPIETSVDAFLVNTG